MDKTINIITAPTSEPVSVADITEHVRFDVSGDTSKVEEFITQAREVVEYNLNRALLTQTIELIQDGFPENSDGSQDSIFRLPRPPLQSVSGLYYTNSAGAETLISADDYEEIEKCFPGAIILNTDKSWPTYLRDYAAVRVQFIAGFTDATKIPIPITTWIKQATSWLYLNREWADLSDYPIGQLIHYKIW